MRIHFIAIGGSIMHSLALALQAGGHEVTGSDDEIYEPSRTRLAKAGLLPGEYGWDPARISGSLDLVVLGMHARRDNPELLRAQALGLAIKSFPEVVYLFSKEKMRIMVAGSHGKTTTSGMVAFTLDRMGIPADRMVGAAISDLRPVQLTDAPIIVLEGDEYLSSPVDPRPKFLHYHPQVTVLTGIAWDHMNVFPTYESYLQAFRDLLRSYSKDDLLIYCADDPAVIDLIETTGTPARLQPYHTHPYRMSGDQVSLVTEQGTFDVMIFGRHNLQNLSGALAAVRAAGGEATGFYGAIRDFTGAQNRLEVLHASDGFIAYKDFAHAPSKVAATVDAVRERHPQGRLIAILELHTFSSLNPDFLPQYAGSMAKADHRVVFFSPHTLAMKKLPDLSASQLRGHFADDRLEVATSGTQLRALVEEIGPAQDTVLLWMSSGRFDELDIKALSESLSGPDSRTE